LGQAYLLRLPESIRCERARVKYQLRALTPEGGVIAEWDDASDMLMPLE
jgi:hypothetical protein